MFNMSVRQLCRRTQVPSTALFYFPEEDKNVTAAVGAKVTVNWQGVHAAAEIIALSGKCNRCEMYYIF